HGAGSLCGRNISSETSSTIGQQRQFNYALRPMPKEEFVRMMTTDLPEAPAYFSRDVAINRGGASELAELPDPPALEARDVEVLQKKGAIVLDTRPAAQYGAGHVPGSLHIGLSGQFASWAGALVSPGTPMLIVAEDEEQVREARLRLARGQPRRLGLERFTSAAPRPPRRSGRGRTARRPSRPASCCGPPRCPASDRPSRGSGPRACRAGSTRGPNPFS